MFILNGATLIPVEVKSAQTVIPDFLSNLKKWASIFGKFDGKRWLITTSFASIKPIIRSIHVFQRRLLVRGRVRLFFLTE